MKSYRNTAQEGGDESKAGECWRIFGNGKGMRRA